MITDTQAVTLLIQLREARAELSEQTAALTGLMASVDALNEHIVKIRQALLYAIDFETEPVKECEP